MLKIFILCSLFAASLAGIIHDHQPEASESETDHHHKIDHEHATSHQSFKIHHYHAVPVYVKHGDSSLLKSPVELGGIKHKLKVLHPKTEHSHSHGLTLENHTEGKDYVLHGYEGGYEKSYEGGYGSSGSEKHHTYETVENTHELDGGASGGSQELSRHQFQDIVVHHGHGESE